MKIKLVDWRIEDPAAAEEDKVDLRPWDVEVKTDDTSIKVEATCPDGTKRELWIEVSDGRLVAHGYDPEHDEPVNLRISKTGITIDSDRHQVPAYHMIDLVQRLARLTTPEEEFEAMKDENGEVWDDGIQHEDVDEMVAEMSSDRLCDEYAAFVEFIKEAKELVK
ncbi:hypothetical protein [Mesorhizobium sp. WSM2239]|uniref:Uncharacterized protein n=2 Tax=unclassified Mesorhizobium TaxID=325217 RepID=A0AAU8DG67_9HYPH